MYTQLLDAAIAERSVRAPDVTESRAVAEVRRRRIELVEGVPGGMDPDTVPAVLAVQIGYDVALLQLASILGVASDPSRFEQPQRERARLEAAFSDLGVLLEPATDASGGGDHSYLSA
jgi:hypothetical protein